MKSISVTTVNVTESCGIWPGARSVCSIDGSLPSDTFMSVNDPASGSAHELQTDEIFGKEYTDIVRSADNFLRRSLSVRAKYTFPETKDVQDKETLSEEATVFNLEPRERK